MKRFLLERRRREEEEEDVVEGCRRQSWSTLHTRFWRTDERSRFTLPTGQLDVDTNEGGRERWPLGIDSSSRARGNLVQRQTRTGEDELEEHHLSTIPGTSQERNAGGVSEGPPIPR